MKFGSGIGSSKGSSSVPSNPRHITDKLTTERIGVILALEADDSRSSLRIEQDERAGVPA